ncbi:mandelate racemase/muconate lactonizing enzyme family protein [Tateyamaria sp. SN6-1]|uniref:mandelate racemase/muconate lactonizing enzyme family protein n=1 Tax=Tateyamaria sp. SN6-1 TaxID=3092148 RepID=UPI0039F54E8C
MKISRITVYQVDLPLSAPYWLSGGRLKFEALDSTFVRIDTDAGITGWGEGCPWGHTYLPAHGPGLRAGLETLAPALIGQDPRSVDHINRIMDVQLPGHAYAKSPVDIACWDILGQVSGLPLWQLLGGAEAAQVLINSSISTDTPDNMVARIEAAAAKGYTVHSAKVGGTDIARDIHRITAISAALPAGHSVTFDVNRAWAPATAVQVLNSVPARNWVEQPCETLEQCAHVARRVSNPIMLDECMHSFGDHLAAWRQDACEGVKVKPNRVGGLTRARQIRDFGVSVGWQMHIEDVGGSALADTAALHLAASTPAANRLASWLCHDHLATDPVPGQGVRNLGGHVTPPSAPGLGVAPDTAALGPPVAVYEAAS